MFQAAEIKHAHAAVCTATDKHVDAVCAKSDVKHLFVMGNQLCFGCQCGDIPDRAGRVNAGRDD